MPSNPVIIISRTDSIGDVVLTLPMAGIIRHFLPGSRIIFLGRDYTRDVIALSEHVDQFISYDDLLKLPADEQVKALIALQATHIVHVFPVKAIAQLAKKANIPNRIGTTNRLWHWFTCNIRVKLSRKNSALHEAQLNTKLLSPLGIQKHFDLEEINQAYGFTRIPQLETPFEQLLTPGKMRVILHPKSKGSAREWGLANFSKLIELLNPEHYTVYISGTAQEGELVKPLLEKHPQAMDLTGKLSLKQFIAFIDHCDALVAASTGPLHIAAALGKKAIGLFSPMRPIHPGRWMPIGPQAYPLVFNADCEQCKAKKHCDCITRIKPEEVVKLLERKRHDTGAE